MGVHYERARLLSSQGRYEQAERELREVLAENPHHGQAHAFLGRCLAEQKRLAEALAECEEAVHLAPHLPYVHYMLGLTYDDCGRLPEAEAALREALRLDPRNAEQLSWLSWIQYRRGDRRAALETAGRGLEIDPENINCLNNQAQYLRVLGHWKQAETVARTALALDPDKAFTHANLAWTLWSKAHALTGNTPLAQFVAAPGWRAEMREACDHFLEALRRDPGSDWARSGAQEVLLMRLRAVFRPLMAAALVTAFLLVLLQPPNPAAAFGRSTGLFLGISGGLAFGLSNGPLYLLLRRSRVGAAVLSPARFRAAGRTAICLGVAVAAAVTALFTPPPAAFGVMFVALALVRPLCVASEAEAGRPQWVTNAYAFGAGVAGLAVLLMACFGREPDQIAVVIVLAYAGFIVSVCSNSVGRSSLAGGGRDKKARAV